MTVSKKQLAANRKNAKKGGVKTDTGKAIVRFNAVKHGLLAKEVVVLKGEGAEDPKEFEQLLNDLKQELQPVGTIEEMLLEKIASLYWRLRRAYRYEVGLIRSSLDYATDYYFDAKDWRGEKIHDQVEKLQEEIEQQQGIIEHWKKDKADLSEKFKKKVPLSEIYDWEENWDHLHGDLDETIDEHNIAEYLEAPDLHKFINTALNWSDAQIWKALIKKCDDLVKECQDKIQELKKALSKEQEKDRMALEVKSKLGQMPGKDSLDRLLRYEGALNRQFYKALNELERIQRLRQGDIVPPPMDINIEVNQIMDE
ncbi:MAG: hypothetical protein ACRBF0_11685 [Calditrichia bacterium]